MKMNIIKALSLGLLSVVGVSSCSDQFLEDKKNYDNVSVDIYNNYDGANTRLNDLYAWTLPNVNADANWQYSTTGSNDGQGKCTEEYSGFGDFVNPESKLSSMNSPKVPDFFRNQSNNIQASVWGRIRNINDFLEGVEGGSLSAAQKDKLRGQALFLRAWCYYQMVKWYGGVPIITKVQETVAESVTPRSSAKACFDFILGDLNESAKCLGSTSWGDADWGRISAASALALKGRVLNLWASPMFNRADDPQRWKNAYSEQLKDIETIKGMGYGLVTDNGQNASAFASVFGKVKSPEALFVTLYNTSTLDDGSKNNGWENSIRPRNIGGSGGKEASAMLVDMFPMSDGKRPTTTTTYTTLEKSAIEYDREFPFANRDPRFYRTFAFPGVRWASQGSTADVGTTGRFLPAYSGGYELWNYVWYVDKNDAGNVESGNSFGADSLLANKKGIYVRKRSVDPDCAVDAAVAWSSLNATYNTGKGYAQSAAPYIEIRYAEVLLNLAEAAAGAGEFGKAAECLREIRQRVGYTGDCGLSANVATDRAACLAAVLYERQIELAYEGKRFDDLRRWMLYDGGATEVSGAPASWKLTGWGGNTCTYLGFTPLNGQRRENMQFRVADSFGVGTDKAESDPIVALIVKAEQQIVTIENQVKEGKITPEDAKPKIAEQEDIIASHTRPAAIDLRKDLASQMDALMGWYSIHLVRKDNKGDARDSNLTDLYITFLPNYYFLGFDSGAQNDNKALPQTIGWEDYNNGGANGTFDPLAE